MTREEQALIDGVEFAIDYRLEVNPEAFERYRSLTAADNCKRKEETENDPGGS